MTRTYGRIGLVAGIAALCVIAWVFRLILLYLVIAVVIGFMGDPLVSLLRRFRIRGRQLPRSLCAGLTLLVFLGVFAGIAWLFVPLIAEEASWIGSLDVYALTDSLNDRFRLFAEWFDGLGLQVRSDDLYSSALNQLRDIIRPEQFTGLAGSVFQWISNVLTGFFSVLFISFFFLRDGSLFYKMVFTLTPAHHTERVKNILVHSHDMLTRYFIGLFVQVVLMTAMVSLGLTAAGIRNAFLIGVFAGLANVVPYVGPMVAVVFGLSIGMTSGLAADPAAALWPLAVRILLVFGIAQVADNWLVQPFVIGPSVRVHPLELFIVLLAAATVGGVVGMAVALPVYSILRIAAREYFREYKVVESLTRRAE